MARPKRKSRGWTPGNIQPIKIEIINTIEAERKVQGVNQTQLAEEALYTTQPNFANHVRKDWNFTLEQTIAILDYLGYELKAVKRVPKEEKKEK